MGFDQRFRAALWSLSEGADVLDEVLAAVSDRMGGARLVMCSLDPSLSGAAIDGVANVDPEVGGLLHGELGTPERNPAMRFLVNSEAGRMLHYRPYIPWDGLVASEFYERVWRPSGTGREAAGMRLPIPGYGDLKIYCGRRVGQEWFDTRELREAETAFHSLARALSYHLSARGETTLLDVGSGAGAALVLDAEKRVLSRTGAADALIGGGIFVRTGEGKARWSDDAAAQLLEPVFAGAVHGRAATTVLPRGERSLIVDGSPGPRSRQNRPTVVLQAGWVRPIEWTPRGLMLAYGLTAREADVAAGLLQGLNPKGIAARHGLKASSVRLYLKRIFDKTETAGQVELLAHLVGSHRAVAPGPI